MKNLMLVFAMLFVSVGFIMTSCSNDDEEVAVSELEKSYFSIENATYTAGEFPTPTSGEAIDGLSINSQALTGGMNFITIVTEKVYKKFFVGVKGVDGYWVYDPTAQTSRATSTSGSDYNTYSIPVMYSTNYDSNCTMMISAEDEDGDISEPYEAEINYVSSLSGDLNINLTFSNNKDVDLHLYMPNGEHIYYGARGGSVETEDGTTVTYGLDKDSNAGCNIDGLNNENIYIPAELIQAGTYTVVVDMFANCNTSIATSWAIAARYKGELVSNEMGANPVSGVYPVGAGNGDMTQVMTFTINDGTRAVGAKRIKANSFKPIPLSDMDEMKKEEAEFMRQYKTGAVK